MMATKPAGTAIIKQCSIMPLYFIRVVFSSELMGVFFVCFLFCLRIRISLRRVGNFKKDLELSSFCPGSLVFRTSCNHKLDSGILYENTMINA